MACSSSSSDLNVSFGRVVFISHRQFRRLALLLVALGFFEGLADLGDGRLHSWFFLFD